jgi:hypothetical protein
MVQEVFVNSSTRKTVSVLACLVVCGAAAFGQGNSANAHNRVPLPVDWSFSHVVYSQDFTPGQAARMQHDPRLYNSWLLQGHVQANSSVNQGGGNGNGGKNNSIARDWSFPLGAAGGVAQNMYPAKFNFDVNAPVTGANCVSDFVVYGLNVAGRITTSTATGSVTLGGGFGTGSDGDTVTIGSKTYRFKNTLAAANDVKIGSGGDRTITAVNLAAAINHDAGEGTLYGTGTTQNPDVSAVASGAGVNLTARMAGSVGNSIPLSVPNGQPGNEVGVSGATLTGGADAQANLIALDNLYSGSNPTGLCGAAPTVKWAYNVTSLSSGKVTSSAALSLDGTKVAFVESNVSASVFHVLQWVDGEGSTSAPVTPANIITISNGNVVSGSCPSAGVSCDFRLTYDTSHGTTNSSPFYDYTGVDTAYVANNARQLTKITPVFGGTPQLSDTNGFSTACSGSAHGCVVLTSAATTTVMTGPVLDLNTGRILIGGSDGWLYAVLSTAAATQSRLQIGSGSANGGAVADPPTVDGSSGMVYAYSAANVANPPGQTTGANTKALVVQADITTPLGHGRTAFIGQGTLAGTAIDTHSGAFDNNFFIWNGSGVNPGHLLMCGTAFGNTSPTLYEIPFSGVSSLTLTNGGNGYSPNPAVGFSGGGGSGATATAAINGSVQSPVTVTAGGSGYTSAPGVTFTSAPAGGVTATGTSAITGVVNSITVTARGSGYTSAPSVVFDNTTAGGSGAAGTANLTGAVQSVGVTAGGSGYTSAPAVSLSGGGGTGATATSAITNIVNSVTVTTPGTGYTSAPTVSLTGGGGSGATATAAVTNIVQSVTVNTGGTGYSSNPGVTFTGGGGSGATATATINGSVASVAVTAGGSYTTMPTVSFTGGGGSGATATATGGVPTGNPPAVTITNGGVCSSAPTVTFSAPPAGGTTTQGTVSFSNGQNKVTGVTVTVSGSGYTSAPTLTFTGGSCTTQPTATAIIAVTAVGVTAGGNNYTSAPGVSFSSGAAAATATISGSVASVNVTSGGTGYTSAPTVGFTGGGGSGATATANLTGVVQSVSVTAGGSGYTSAPTVGFTGGGGSGAAATANLTGIVQSVTVTAGGSNYTSAPTVGFSGGGGSGATATASITSVVNSVTITSGGSAYTSAPGVSFSGGGGSGTTATASITNAVQSITLTNAGSGYTSAPTVSFTGGGGTGAAATATIAGPVASLSLTNGGNGYTSAPTVTISGGDSTAAATAVVGGIGTGTPATTKAISNTQGLECSPMNEIFNSSTDLVFFGVGNASNGQVTSEDVTDASLTPAFTTVTEPSALGGTSGIVIDNISNQPQAASIYFSTQATSTASVSISAISGSAGVVTVTAATTPVFQVGQPVVISGAGGFNGTFVVASINPSANQFTYNSSASGVGSSGTAALASGNFLAVKLTQSGLN